MAYILEIIILLNLILDTNSSPVVRNIGITFAVISVDSFQRGEAPVNRIVLMRLDLSFHWFFALGILFFLI